MAKGYRLLTWHKARKCWRKKYNGKVYYLSKAGDCKSPNDIADYQRAVAYWDRKKAEIDGNTAVKSPVTVPQKPDTEHAAYRALKAKRSARVGVATAEANPKTIDGLIRRYVEGRRIESQAGQLSLDTYREAKFKLAEFAKYCADNDLTNPNDLTAEVLTDYRKCQIELTDPSKAEPADLIGKITCQKRLARLKQFLEFAWEQKYLAELPRNIKRFARISMKGEVSRVKRLGFFTLDECRRLYKAAFYKQRLTGQEFQRTRLYILLALNCGYTQKDISTLEHKHIDWKAGIIDRPRHKTGSDQKHKLWPVTLRLLKAEVSDPAKHQLALLGKNGNRLVTEKIRDDGIPSVTDAVKLAFNRVKVKLGMADDERGFATFRKTGSNILKKHFGNEVCDLYLAHTTKATRKHYTTETYDTYFDALDWLGRHFAFKLEPTKSGSAS